MIDSAPSIAAAAEIDSMWWDFCGRSDIFIFDCNCRSCLLIENNYKNIASVRHINLLPMYRHLSLQKLFKIEIDYPLNCGLRTVDDDIINVVSQLELF